MSTDKRERELAKELLVEKLGLEKMHEEARKWVIDRLERHAYRNYQFKSRNMSYVKYITQLYINNRGIKVIRKKYFQLIKDLKETQEKLYERKNIVIKEGTRAWAALHLPPPTMATGDGGFLELRDEIGIAKPIWEDVYNTINVKVSYMKKLI